MPHWAHRNWRVQEVPVSYLKRWFTREVPRCQVCDPKMCDGGHIPHECMGPDILGDFSKRRTEIIYGRYNMYLNDYQHKAVETAQYDEPMYPIASLMVESAELGDLFIKPWLRGDKKDIDRQEVVSEAGDVLWNLACLLADMEITLDEVAQYNIAKLKSRKERGVIEGSGGNR